MDRGERTQAIAASEETGRTIELWVGDRRKEFEIRIVPVEALVLNVDNRRFRAERLWVDEELGRPLDPENTAADALSVESLLLDKSHRPDGDRIVGSESSATAALENDWLRRGQDTPFWIRPDGTVRNGNRRLAMIRRAARRGGADGLHKVQAIILDHDDIDEPTLLEMEQREQLTENFKVRYADIDYLLALKEAAINRDTDWFDRDSLDRVAGELQGVVEKTKSEVLRDLYAIKYMDVFLRDAGQEGQYHRLIKTLERFRDIGRTMMPIETEDPDADRVLQVMFAAVRGGLKHDDIRDIRQIYRKDPDRFASLAERIDDLEQEWNPEAPPSDAESDTQVEEEAAEHEDDEIDEDDTDEGPGPDVPNYPKRDVAAAIRVTVDGYKTASGNAGLVVILGEIVNRLDSVSAATLEADLMSLDEGARSDALVALRRIRDWISESRDAIESQLET